MNRHCIFHLLQLSGHWDEFGRRSTNVAIQSPVVSLLLRVAAGTCSSQHQVVVPITNHHLIVHIPKVPISAATNTTDCSSNLSSPSRVSRPWLLLCGKRWRQNLSLRLCLVADNQQLLQGAPTAEGIILKPEAAGSWRGAAWLGDEFAGCPAVSLLIRPARYETAHRTHGCVRTAMPTGARAGT